MDFSTLPALVVAANGGGPSRKHQPVEEQGRNHGLCLRQPLQWCHKVWEKLIQEADRWIWEEKTLVENPNKGIIQKEGP